MNEEIQKELEKLFGGAGAGLSGANTGPTLTTPQIAQDLRGGAGEKPIQFVLKGNTYEELIKWKH